MCRNRARIREVGGGFAIGQDTDLLLRMHGKHVIQAEVHTCARCRFSGYAADFLRTISPGAQRRFLDEVSPALEDGASSDGALHVASEASPPQGERLVRAYWCLRLPPSLSLPLNTRKSLGKIYLKGAIQKLRQGLRQEGDPSRLYLIGELCRRNENFLLAVSYFRRFLEREDGARYLKQAAVKLIQAARENSPGGMSMEEILYNNAQDANNWQERDWGP